MLNWYISMLILLGFLTTAADWDKLSTKEQQDLIIIVDEIPH